SPPPYSSYSSRPRAVSSLRHHTPPTPLHFRLRRHPSLLRWLLRRRRTRILCCTLPVRSRADRPAVVPPPRGPPLSRPPRQRCCSTVRTRSPPPAAPSAARPRPTGWRGCCCTSAATTRSSTTTTSNPPSPYRPAPPLPTPLDRVAILRREQCHPIHPPFQLFASDFIVLP
ncbi:hypothetical protein PMAYCL1PPCAC_06164, partial [Pristionchus mayeri]